MEFIILPLTYKGNGEKNQCIKATIQMASKISDEESRVFLLSGVAVFANKVIKIEYAKEYAKKQNLRLLVNLIESGNITEELAAETLNCSIEEFKQMRDSLMQL